MTDMAHNNNKYYSVRSANSQQQGKTIFILKINLVLTSP